MKGFLFFLGSTFRWAVQRPNQFLTLHLYFVVIYGLTFFIKNVGFNFSNLILTSGMIAPIGYLIYNGLPLDCLDYKSAIKRELKTQN